MPLSKKRSFDIVIITPNLRFKGTLESIKENSSFEHEICLIDNGATYLGFDLSEYKDIIKLALPDCSNRLPAVYNMAFKTTETNPVMFVHNDVIILGKGWDEQVEKYFDESIGVMGFCGCTGIGMKDIYKEPFRNEQLARLGFHWNFDNEPVRQLAYKLGYSEQWLHAHGPNLREEYMTIVTVDGLCMIVNRRFFEESGGFDEDFLFHGFDDDLCLSSLSRGYRNMAVNIPYFHLGCGGTEGHIKLREAQNVTEGQLHDIGCRLLYDKWKRLLPVRMK